MPRATLNTRGGYPPRSNPRKGTAMATSTTPDISKMTADELAAFVAEASKQLAEHREREAEEKRAEALRTIRKTLTDASADLHRAGEAVESGDIKGIIANLNSVIDGAREAVRSLGGRAPRKTGNGNGNGGGQRESSLRDQILQVFADHPGADF